MPASGNWKEGEAYNGMFWLAENSEDAWPGIIKQQPSGLLYIHCTPAERDIGRIVQEDSVVLGRIEGRYNVRLDKCTASSGRHIDPEVTLEAWFERGLLGSPRSIAHANKLRRTGVWLSELNGWASHRMATFTKPGQPGHPGVALHPRENIILHDAAPRVTLGFDWRGYISPKRSVETTEIEATPFIIIAHEPSAYDDIRWEIDTIQKFFSFCLGTACCVEHVECSSYVSDNKSEWNTYFRRRFDALLIDQFTVPAKEPKALLRHEYSMAFSTMKGSWKQLYGRFRAFARNHPLYLETLIAPYYNATTPDELQFATLAFAAEGYHRETVGGTFIDRNQYRKSYLRSLRAAIPQFGNPDLEEAISQGLGHFNQKSLRRRLTDFADALPQSVLDVLFRRDTPEEFLRKVVLTRNYLAHRDPDGAAQCFQAGSELHWGLQRLHALLVSSLLTTFELPESLVAATAARLIGRSYVTWGHDGRELID